MDGLPDDAPLAEVRARIARLIAPYTGRADYGNLRMRIWEWDHEGDPFSNIALVYETPEGSTDQINVLYLHDQRLFELVDQVQGEVSTPSPDVVLQMIQDRIDRIPHSS